jgi:hypothetical protein
MTVLLDLSFRWVVAVVHVHVLAENAGGFADGNEPQCQVTPTAPPTHSNRRSIAPTSSLSAARPACCTRSSDGVNVQSRGMCR